MIGPTVSDGQPPASQDLILEVRNLRKYFPVYAGVLIQRKLTDVKAVDDVSFVVRRGETLGLVGESGSGKTTIGRCIIQLEKPTDGEVLFEGVNLTTLNRSEMRPFRRKIQMVFQDPYSSLNPRMKVLNIVGEALTIHKLTHSKREYRLRVGELLEQVGLNPDMASRYPHEFSGGQRQRIGVARALAVEPQFIVADEPVSALDVSIQAQLINLLKDIQQEMDLTYLIIAHDLAVVRHVSDRIAVMYLGKLMEIADWTKIYEAPLHPYTKALLSAVPIPDPDIEVSRERIVLRGSIPSPAYPPAGCVFHTRCPVAVEKCAHIVPEMREVLPGHWAACHLV